MKCEDVLASLSAYLDGQASGLESHLAECASCRQAFETMKRDDTELRATMAAYTDVARRKGDTFAAMFRTPRKPLNLFPLAAVGLVAAVLIVGTGILLVRVNGELQDVRNELAQSDRALTEVASLRSQLRARDDELAKLREGSDPQLRKDYEALAKDFENFKRGGLGRLTHLLGGMEVVVDNGSKAEPAYIGMPLFPLTCVRTAPGTKAAFHMSDGSELRLNEGTELTFLGGRQVRVASGEVWAQVQPGQEKFQVHTRDGRVEVLGTEIDVRVEAKYFVLMVLSGKAELIIDKLQRQVNAGEAAAANKDEIKASTVDQMERATRWMLDLLVARGRDNPELNRQIAQLLEMMGKTKLEYLTESEIKAYGSACTIPIARYLKSPSCAQNTGLRQKAIGILVDIGDWYAVDTYIELLQDPDPSIRRLAAKGLYRVTAQDLGCDATYWSNAPLNDRDGSAKKWGEWWAQVRSTKVTDDLEKQLDRVKKEKKF